MDISGVFQGHHFSPIPTWAEPGAGNWAGLRLILEGGEGFSIPGPPSRLFRALPPHTRLRLADWPQPSLTTNHQAASKTKETHTIQSYSNNIQCALQKYAYGFAVLCFVVVIQWNLYKMTTKFCGLSRQVVPHGKENKHDFVKNVPDKWWNSCVLSKTCTVSLYRFHCINKPL